MKLLAVGDMHLGRRPSRLPAELSHQRSDLTPAAAWRRTVDYALEEKVDALLLAGDVIESERDFFEGFGHLKQGVDRLIGTGIQVIAVAGNHDVFVLPKLADVLADSGGFKLLGRGGQWEAYDIRATNETLRLWGWSFPERIVRTSPLTGVHFERRSSLELGLLHCDLDVASSPYAPVSRRELSGSGLDGWLLGHIHQPDALRADALCGYLGCLSGMDPGEFGARGPWMLHIEGGRIRELSQVPLAPLRWLRSDLDVSDLEDPEAIEGRLIKHIEALDEEISASAPAPKAVGIRLTLVGRSQFASALSRWAEAAHEFLPHFTHLDIDYFVEHLASAVLPEIDLQDYARQQNPLGLLCRTVLLLDQPQAHSERTELINTAKRTFERALDRPTWRGLESNSERLADAEVIARLRQAGMQAIIALHSGQLESVE